MAKEDTYLYDYITYKDGHVEILYTIGNSDEVFMRDAEAKDQKWLHRMKRLNKMPDETSVKLW